MKLASAVAALLALACTRADKLDAIVAPHSAADGPGLAIAVIKDGRVVARKTYGLADIASMRPMTAASVFDLASLGKQFTGAAVLLLAAREQLSLDDDVRKYLPEVPLFDENAPIRLRHLATHTSGLTEFKHDSDIPKTSTEILSWPSAQRELAAPTGSRFEYTNVNYFLLARVVERVSKKSWGTFLRDDVFAPSKMTTAQALEDPATTISGRVTGYCEKEHKPCRWDTFDTGAANVFASLDDMIAWDAAWRGRAMPTDALLEATRDQRYALGWFRGRMGGHEFLSHDGDWLGASTYIARYLDKDLTVIVLSNQARVPVDELGRRIADLYL